MREAEKAESGYSRKGGREGVKDFEDCNEIFVQASRKDQASTVGVFQCMSNRNESKMEEWDRSNYCAKLMSVSLNFKFLEKSEARVLKKVAL